MDGLTNTRWDFIGLSTDTKPTPATSNQVVDGSTYFEADTSKLYFWTKDQWYNKTSDVQTNIERKMKYPLCAVSAVGLGEKFFENKEFHAVSSYEYEVMTADPLKCRMLDFLSHTKLLVNLSNVEHFDLKYLQVHVTKLIDGLYRLTCVQ